MTDFADFTPADFRGTLAAVVQFLREERGYDTVNSPAFCIEEDTIILTVYAMDDYQRSVDYARRQSCGTMSFAADTIDEFWNELSRLPNRQMRELRVLLAETGAALDSGKKMRSAFAREFVAALDTEHKRNQLLLESRAE